MRPVAVATSRTALEVSDILFLKRERWRETEKMTSIRKKTGFRYFIISLTFTEHRLMYVALNPRDPHYDKSVWLKH